MKKEEISTEEIKEKNNANEILIPRNELLDLLLSYITTDKTELNDVLAGYFSNILLTLIDKYPTKLILYFYILRKDVLVQIINHSYQKSLSKLSFKILKIEDILNNILLDVKKNPSKFNTEFLIKKVEESIVYRNELVGKIILSLILDGFKDQKGNIINNVDIEPLFDLLNDLIQEKKITSYIVNNSKIYNHIFGILEKEIINKSENEEKNYISFIILLTSIFSVMNKFNKEFDFLKNPENNESNEIKDDKKEISNFFEKFKEIFIKILSYNYNDDSTISSINSNSNKIKSFGLRNIYIFLLVIEVFNYMKDKALDFDKIIINSKFLQKSIDYFFKYQLNNIYHYRFFLLFNLYLENASEHSLLTDYIFKEMKFHETLADYINKEEELNQNLKKDEKIKDKKEEPKNLQNGENKIINQQEKNDKKENNIESIDSKEEQKNIKTEINKEKDKIENENNKAEEKEKKEEKKDEKKEEKEEKEEKEKKEEKKEEKEDNKESKEEVKEDKKEENKNEINQEENEKNKTEKNSKIEEVKENKIGEVKENKIEKVEENKKICSFVKKKTSLIYPLIVGIIYKIQAISGLKTLDETDKKNLNILNLGDFEFVKDENSIKTVKDNKTYEKLNEILKASNKWISTFDSLVLPEIKRYESKLCPDNTISKEKPKPAASSINNLLGLLNLISNNLNKKNQNEQEKKKEEKDINQSSSTEKIEPEKKKEENSINKQSSAEIEEKNSKYNDTNFWLVNSESLVDEKEMEGIINNL